MATSESLLAELLRLTPAERIQLAEDLWDSVAALPDGMPAFTEEQIAEWERRLAEHDRDPSTAVPGRKFGLVSGPALDEPKADLTAAGRCRDY